MSGPSRKGYVFAAAVLAAGVVGFALVLFLGLSGLSMQRVVVPGSAELALEEPGRYTIYHESRSVVDGRVYDVADVSGLTVELVSAETGESVPLDSPGANTTYDLRGRSGRGVLTFEVDRPGAYRLSADYPAGDGPETVLAVGKGLGTRIAMTVAGVIAIGIGSFLLAAAIAVVTFVRRRRAIRAAPPVVNSNWTRS
ncbi:MAG TPA: hypothetical protein VEY33_08970 [Gemmatimonadota bacterium]|nr:hypothetical protein [Gemmatimonadota bacterium]